MKVKTAFGSATVLALSCAAVPALAGECTQSDLFSSYFLGGSNANCTIADKTILGISQNDIAETQGIEITAIFDTPADDPGIQFFVNTIFDSGDGASFVFSVTAPRSTVINGVSLSLGSSSVGSATVTGSLSNGDSLLASLGETSSINFDPTNSLTVTLSQASSGDGTANFSMRFSETAAVPEPSSAALVGVGLAVSGLARWRKRRAGAPKSA
jgi:PEP-CTERM motif